MVNKPKHPKWFDWYLTGTTIVAIGIATYWIKNPEKFHPRPSLDYNLVVPAPDLNNDRIPELVIHHKDGTIDTLLSRIKNGEIIYVR